MRTRRPIDWLAVKKKLEGTLSNEEMQIVDFLIAGKSTPEIASMLRQHRSMVWRKVQNIRERVSEG